MITDDPIVAEVRATRDKHAAQFGYDLDAIFRDIREKQKASGREYVTFPPRKPKHKPAVAVGEACDRSASR